MARVQLAPIHTRLLKTWTVIDASAVGWALTGTTSETAYSPTITIPAGWIGANGVLRIWSLWSMTNNANNKTLRNKFGGTTWTQIVATTNRSYVALTTIRNRNAANSQVSLGSAGTGVGSGAGDPITAAIDTTSPQDVTFSGQLANSADTLTLEGYTVELQYKS